MNPRTLIIAVPLGILAWAVVIALTVWLLP